MIEVVVKGEPIGFKRVAHNPRGSCYTPRAYGEYKELIINHILCYSSCPPPHRKDRYALSMQVYRSKDVGDLDNYAKPVMDALEQSGVICNDKYITEYRPPFEMLIDKDNPRLWFKLVRII